MNIVHYKRDSYDVYVGRPTKWGNPYSAKVFGRHEALQRYLDYLHATPELISAAKNELAGKVLACWCAPVGGLPIDAPLWCHAQILARAARGDYDPS